MFRLSIVNGSAALTLNEREITWLLPSISQTCQPQQFLMLLKLDQLLKALSRASLHHFLTLRVRLVLRLWEPSFVQEFEAASVGLEALEEGRGTVVENVP